ncbi:MAG: ABC transporter ATP-binding protein [Acidimicrobiia bacterium]
MPDLDTAAPFLAVDGVSLSFGGTHALRDVTLRVERGRITGLIGPNGAGKTSLLNCICGYYRPTSGTIGFEGAVLTSWSTARIAAQGIGRTFQTPQLSHGLDVLQNVMLGLHRYTDVGLLAATIPWRRGARAEREARRQAVEVLDLLGIGDQAPRSVGELSFAQQKVVEIARAVATRPELLLLDEPGSGMSAEEKRHVSRLVGRLRDELGITPVIIEHDIGFIRELCDVVVVLDFGAVLTEGPAAEVLADPRVVAAYVGSQPDETAPRPSIATS